MNSRKKILCIILTCLAVQGFTSFGDSPHVFGQPIITRKWRANAGTGSTWLGPLAADLNNDGLMEIVITGINGVAAVNPIDGSVLWSAPYGGGHCPFEIIDLNKDGIPEILLNIETIGGSSASGVVALHGNNGSVYWYNSNAAGNGNFMAVADINADGYPEIYCAIPGQVTGLTYDGRIFARTYTYYTCWGGMTIGDTDFDGVFEVYLGERSNTYPSPSSPGRGLRAFWADNLTEIWCHPDILCSSQAPVLADVDKDGDLEIIILHQRGGIAVINTDGSVNTYNGKYRKQLSISGLSNGHRNPTVADVDNDGNLELIQCGDANHNAYPPVIWDLVDWKLDAKLPFSSIDPPGVADIDGDERLEIIAPNAKNITIFKYNPTTKNYDVVYTIPLANAHPFSIAQDIDGDDKLELVFNQFNSWISVYDVEAPAPTPLPRSGLYFYSQYRTREPVYVPSPQQPPKISEISPSDGATSVPTTLSQLSFKLTDYQNDLMNYTVTTNPDIGSVSGINVPGGEIKVPVNGLAPSTTYNWTVTATDGTCVTTRTFTFYTEGNVTLTMKVSPEGSGSVIKNLDSETYAYGTRVQLTAVTDNVVYKFSRWDGALKWMGSNNPATIIMNGNKTVTAVFTKKEYTLTISISPTGCGSVNVNKNKPYYYGDVVELTAVPNVGWSFSHWTGDLTGSQNPATIIMNSNKKVTAVFTQEQYYILTVNIVGSGSVSKNPDQTSCTPGSVVTLTATPVQGWSFSGWSGDLTGNDNPATITMDGSKIVTATFTQLEYTLTLNVNGNGQIIKSPNQPTYTYGTIVELTATAENGWTFSHWNGDASGSSNPTTITIDGDKSVTAVFTQSQYTLTINIIGSGTVTKTPDYAVYSHGEIVILTATPEPGWSFSSWSGDLYGSNNPATVTMDSNKVIIAVFTENQYTLTVNVDGGGSVAKMPDLPTYAYGTVVQLTATPEPGYAFSHWTGDISSSTNPEYINVNGNKVVTAVFIEISTNWWNTAWKYRRTITIDHTKVSGELVDFPLLVEIVDGDFAGKAQPDGHDFVFVGANNMKLNHQIEYYDSTTGHLIVWVKVPHLSSTLDTILYIYYGNPECENQQNPTMVWDESYKLVMHLNENTGIHYDSTMNGNNGAPINGVLQGVPGQIDGADTFDGRNDYLEIPHSDALAGYSEALTISFWMKLGDTSRRQTILCKYNTAGNMRSWQIEYDPEYFKRPFWFFASENGITYREWWASWESFRPEANIWYYLTVVWEKNVIPKFYINGVQVPTVGTATISSIFNNRGTPLDIGRSLYSGRYFKGSLDEITISDKVRSAEWIFTEYNNQLNPIEFCCIGAEETFE